MFCFKHRKDKVEEEKKENFAGGSIYRWVEPSHKGRGSEGGFLAGQHSVPAPLDRLQWRSAWWSCDTAGAAAHRRPLCALLFTILSSHRPRDAAMLRPHRAAASFLPRGSRAVTGSYRSVWTHCEQRWSLRLTHNEGHPWLTVSGRSYKETESLQQCNKEVLFSL